MGMSEYGNCRCLVPEGFTRTPGIVCGKCGRRVAGPSKQVGRAGRRWEEEQGSAAVSYHSRLARLAEAEDRFAIAPLLDGDQEDEAGAPAQTLTEHPADTPIPQRVIDQCGRDARPGALAAYWNKVSGAYDEVMGFLYEGMVHPSQETFAPCAPMAGRPMGELIARCEQVGSELGIAGAAQATIESLWDTETGRGYRRCYARFRSGRGSDTSEYARLKALVLDAVRGLPQTTTGDVLALIKEAATRAVETTVGQVLADAQWRHVRRRIEGRPTWIYLRTQPDEPLPIPVTDEDVAALLSGMS